MEENPSRSLTVVLHADVVGSTVLVRMNETLAHQRIRDVYQRFSETIAGHGGTPHEIRGDALVAEFPLASDAINAALAFQAANTRHNENLPDEVRPVLRVGVAIGEVVISDSTITGEAVVLAQRLEQLADAGGVCIQGAAYETIPRRFPFEFESLGEHVLKGFSDPVRIYSVTQRDKLTLQETLPSTKSGKAELAENGKPTIAVLPFDNMSGDSDQEYFSDGITEDIITELTRFRSLSVIARHSTFTYKGRAVNIKELADALGVQYVVEGSVRKSGSRIRITAQLIETETGDHLWAERYDRMLEDIFEIQDEVSQTVVATIAGQLDEVEARRVRQKPPENMTAYDYFLRGLQQYGTHDRKPLIEARKLFQKSIELDASYARAHAYLALTIFTQVFYVYTDGDDLEVALSEAEKALAIDKDEPIAHASSGLVMFMQGRDSWGIAALRRAIDLNPNDPELAHWLGFILTYSGELAESIEWLRVARRLNPLHGNCHVALGIALYLSKNYDEAINALNRDRGAEWWGLCYFAAANAQLGRIDEARSAVQRFLTNLQAEFREWGRPVPNTGLEIAKIETAFFRRDSDAEHLLDGLRKAGLFK